MARLSSELEQFFAQGQREVDAALRRLIATPWGDAPIANLDDALAYSLGLDAGAPDGGKRLRPLLCLLVCSRLSGKTEPALPFAAGIELMHNFALVHDDIEDGDEYRRGRPAVWKKYGLPHGINIGDYLFTRIFAALLMNKDSSRPETVVRFFDAMNTALDHTHRGQALEMNARSGPVTLDQYMRIVTEKTGYYLAAPLIAGVIAAEGPAEYETVLGRFGLLLGPMFQIADDLIDLTNGKGREAIGSDIREGKRSFLVAHVCRVGSEEDKKELLRILDLSRQDTTPEDVRKAIGIFEQYGAFDEARKTCVDLKIRALSELESLPPHLRDPLREVTEYLVDRKK